MPRCLKIATCAALAGVVSAQVKPAFAQVSACPVEKAVYQPVSREPHEAGTRHQATFRRQAQHIANEAPFVMTIRESSKGLSFTFSFFRPNGYAQTIVRQRQARTADDQDEAKDNIQGDVDDAPASTALFFDSTLVTIAPLFERKPSAPAYMLFPDLGKAFWYGHVAGRAFLPPAGMWKLAACRT